MAKQEGQHLFVESNANAAVRLSATIPSRCLRHIPASPVFALPSRLGKIGLLNRALKEDSVPRKPGIRKSNKHHNVRTLCWMGVPERIKRWTARGFSFRVATLPSTRWQRLQPPRVSDARSNERLALMKIPKKD